MAKNAELQAILDERNVSYEGLNNAQLKKLVKETAPTEEPAAEPPADETAPDEAPAETPVLETSVTETGTLPITRIQANDAWTCPFCDRAHYPPLTECDGCGAVREGDEATR